MLGAAAALLSISFALTVSAAKPKAGAAADAGAGPDAAASAAPASTDGSGAPSSSASSASSADAAAGTSDVAPDAAAGPAAPAPYTGTVSTAVPVFRPHAAPLPPPTNDQMAAYQAMRQEADAYQRAAGDYKDAITTIVTLHYEEQKKSILGGLDREIGVEKEELRKARDGAIKRLEDFVAKYTGALAQPEATPDAMYRLSALYEERARSDDDPNSDLAVTLKPAIALYKRVVREFPKYGEIAGIYYFLGHALNDSRRQDEAQQVWRSLVCHNHYVYPVPPDPKAPDTDKILPLPQDHDENYWKAWRYRYVTPQMLKRGVHEETTFADPYPQDCQMLPQPSLVAGTQPKYVGEIWWRMGDWEFDQLDIKGGVIDTEPSAVWDYNRAASAYTHSLEYKKPPLYGVALYKLAWTFFKQQRYEAATREFVHLLNYTDEQEKLTGDPGADFRSEAFTYIAGSLDNYDFAGPPPEEPYIARPDVLDTARSPAEAEAKLRIGLDRCEDAKIIPQDKPWTIEIYKALAIEYRTINQYKNALAVYQVMLDKWPLDASAPDSQSAMAEVYDLLAKQTKIGDERREFEQKVLESRTALAKYIGDTPWVDANKDNPGALQRAEELAKTGLKGAAITHTRNGQAALESADQTGDTKEKLRLTVYALGEYRLAAVGWLGYLKQDENAPDAYKSRYFYADALHNQVRLAVALHQFDAKAYPEPTSDELAKAEQAAIDVRDSDEDDQFIDNAGLFVVDLADVDRDLAFQRFQDSGGTQGVEPRKDFPRMEGPEGDKSVVGDPLPDVIQTSMKARDEYITRVPPDRDKQNNGLNYAFYSADQFYLYGHFDVAQPRFEAIYKDFCGKDPLGYEAWKRLIVMSNLQKNAERSRQLAEAEKNNSCAKTDLQKAEEKMGDLTDLVLQNAAFDDANKVFEQAKAAPPGPGKDALWRKAGIMYEAALRAAPSHKDAPAAAINSAYCYKQVGQFGKAIDLYELFIGNYGSETILDRLQKGGVDPEKKVKVAPNPQEYGERIKYLGMAYDALSTTYYGFFAYQRAAESFGKIAANPRFDDTQRSNAAHIAMVLYSNLGDRANMNRMYGVLVDPKMHMSSEKHVEADYLRASFDYGLWNPSSESAGNTAARTQAIATLNGFHNANKGRPEAARFVLESAYRIGKMLQSVNDPNFRSWFKTIITDWEFFKTHPAGDSKAPITANDVPYSDYGGEADFTLVDEQVKADFDYSTGHHHYTGNAVDVKEKVDKDLGDADKKWLPLLSHVATQYGSFQWAAAATARIGSLYDSIRSGLDLAVPNYFTPKQDAAIKKLQDLVDKLQAAGQNDKADQVQQMVDDTRDKVRAAWRSTKDQYMEACNQKMVGKYVTAALIARKYNVKDTAVQNGVGRLAFFTDYLGDDKIKPYVEATPDPLDPNTKLTYVNGEFLQWRSGVIAAPPANGQPAPIPATP